MHILFISEYYPPKIMGGGEINLSMIARGLVKRGINVSVLTSFHKGLEKYEKQEDVNIYRRLKTASTPSGVYHNFIRSTSFPKSVITETKRLSQEQTINIIHFIGTSITTAKELSKLKIPLIATIESYPALCPKGDRIYQGTTECTKQCSWEEFQQCQHCSEEIGKTKNKWYIKYNPFLTAYIYNYYQKLHDSLKHCTLIAISKYVQDLLQQQGFKSTVIPNIIDVDAFAVQKEHLPSSKPNVLYLGSLIKSKGPHILLEAVRGVNVHCDLYGEGVMKEELQQMINRFNLDATIHPPVPHEEIPQIYANADIVVFPSLWPEPFGRIAVEAMAAGKPVIGSNVGGIKETILEDIGMIINPGDAIVLRNALKEIINNTNKYKKISKNGEKEAKKYSKMNIIEKFKQLYETKLRSNI